MQDRSQSRHSLGRNPSALLPSNFLSTNTAGEYSPTILREHVSPLAAKHQEAWERQWTNVLCVILGLMLLRRFKLNHGMLSRCFSYFAEHFAEARSLGGVGGTPLCRQRRQEARESESSQFALYCQRFSFVLSGCVKGGWRVFGFNWEMLSIVLDSFKNPLVSGSGQIKQWGKEKKKSCQYPAL